MRVARRALAGLTSLAVMLLAVEVYLRGHIHVPTDPHFPFAQTALQRTVVTLARPALGLDARRVVVHTNALGLRGDDLDPTDTQTFRVVTLGGSVTECLLLRDEDTWPHRLQDVLRAGSGRRIWVGNAARSGHSTLDYTAHARVLLHALRPDLVIVMAGANDLQAAVEDRLIPMDLSDRAVLSQYSDRLYAQGDVEGIRGSYLNFMVERYFTSPSLDITGLYERMSRRRRAARLLDVIPNMEDATDVYRANLRQLVEALAQVPSRPRVLMLTHPSLWKAEMSPRERDALWGGYTCMDCERAEYYSPRALAAALDGFNRELQAVSAAAGVPCLDLAARVPKTLDNFYDDAHLRELGARLVADTVGQFLLRERLVP